MTFAKYALAGLMLASAASAQDVINRVELDRQPLSNVAGYEVVVSRITLAPGGAIPLHTHPGDEHAVVLEGGTVRLPNGKEVTFEEGKKLFFPEGLVHGGLVSTNAAPMVVLTTHIVRAGEPLSTLVE